MSKARRLLSMLGLTEMAFDFFKGTPIFVNPNKNEVEGLRLGVRFIADGKSKKIYVWDASQGGVHSDVWSKVLKKSGSCYLENGKNSLLGFGTVRRPSPSDDPETHDIEASGDWAWVFKYFSKLGLFVRDAWTV